MKTIVLLLMLAVLSAPAKARAGVPGPLVGGAWLVENQGAVVILDARKEIDTFADGHIPGAILVDVNTIRTDRVVDGKTLINMRPQPAAFQQFMRAHGVNNDSIVVITHAGNKPGQVAGAARLYWQMKYYGFDQVALLDGGNQAWIAELEDLDTAVDAVIPGDFRVSSERSELVATMEQVRHALHDDALTLIDTRDLRYHVGMERKDYVFVAGHIPGSGTMPYKFLHPAKSMRFHDRDTYDKLLDSLRIEVDSNIIVYCNSAYEASSNWFVLHEILGMPNVRIYDGSLHQWTQYDSNPMIARLSD